MVAHSEVDDAQAYVLRVVKDAGTSFYWAMKLLPAEKQHAMFAVYAFCRAVDDIADADSAGTAKLDQLGEWEREIGALYGGRPSHPIGHALRPAVAAYGLRKDDFVEIIRGMEMDARGPIRAPTMAELELYCARVAGAVGLLSVRIFGCGDARAPDFALATGQALQLTNILRDIDEDADDGRLYLPRELLAAAGISGDDPHQVRRHPALPEVCRALAEVADESFATAASLRADMAPEDAETLRPAAIMTAVYRRLFERMAARDWRHLDQPVRLSKAEKLWLALRIAVLRR